MRIAQVVCVYPPERGGIGQVAKDYTEALRARGHEVVVFHSGSDRVALRFGNARLFFSLLWRLRSFDLVHLHYPFYGAQVFTAIACRLFKIPLVATFHMRATGTGIKGWIFWLSRILGEGPILRTAKRLFVSSADYLSAQGVVHPSVIELPFGADEHLFFPNALERASQPTLLFVGGMDSAHYFKGIPILLRALVHVSTPGVVLELVGDGNLRGVFETLAKRLGLQDRVRFLGALSDEDKAKAYRRAWVHLLPSTTKAEAFGIVTVESALSGTPSIVSDLPGVRTVVEHGVTGFITPPSDADRLAVLLNEVLASPDRLALLGRNASVRARERYAPAVLFDRLESCYNEVI